MKVFITGGAGLVGSTTAFCLATRELADEVVLQDLNENAVASHAMDMAQCTFVTSKTRVTSGGWEAAAGADVVIVAAGLPALEATHDACRDVNAMKPLIRSVADGVNRYCPEAVVLSLTNPLDTFLYALYDACGLPARQFIAMSVNDSLRFRYGVAMHLGLDPAEVDAFVVGEHSPAKVQLFSTVKVRGEKRIFPAEEQAQILKETNAWWQKFLDVSGARTASWTTGCSAALTLEHLAGKRTGPICCSCILEDGLAMGWPVTLDRTGVVRREELALTDAEAASVAAAKRGAKASIAKVLAYMKEHD